MGRTSQIVENPAVKTLKWKNEKIDKKTKKVTQETGWYYWDKTGNEGEGENVKVPLPITFLWLESASSVSGYSEKKESGIYSNEVLDTRSQPMTVKVGKDTLTEGFWKDIKEEVKAEGGKYCTAVYALVMVDDKPEIWRFLMTGASNSWLSFSNNSNNRKHAIVCYDTKFETKGSVEYEEPVFKYVSVEKELLELADQLYTEQVEPYFNYILEKPKVEEGSY
jgi:hypothetical protein